MKGLLYWQVLSTYPPHRKFTCADAYKCMAEVISVKNQLHIRDYIYIYIYIYIIYIYIYMYVYIYIIYIIYIS